MDLHPRKIASTTTWKVIPLRLSKWLITSLFFSHEVKGHVEWEQHNPIAQLIAKPVHQSSTTEYLSRLGTSESTGRGVLAPLAWSHGGVANDRVPNIIELDIYIYVYVSICIYEQNLKYIYIYICTCT